ncbi:MAG: FG-GAP-like repeat-containing protein [Thermodesulfobacteriota bacterium]
MRLLFFSVAVTLLAGMPCLAGQEAETTIAVLPFKINADRDLSYLREGVADMFVARLSAEKGLAAVKPSLDEAESRGGVSEDEAARKIGGSLGADRVLYGSLTVFGSSISLDAKVLGVKSGAGPLVFSRQAASVDEVIPAVQAVAREVAAAHAASWTAGVVAEPVTAGEGAGFWKSRNFEAEISGISAGDVDADGKVEIVLIADKSLQVWRKEDGELKEITGWEAGAGRKLLGVDIADINGNGKAEIFVTAIRPDFDGMNSLVLEWKSGSLQPVSHDPAWFYRVVPRPGGKPMLVGQKKGFEEPFLPGIHELTWDGTGYRPGKRYNLPAESDLLSLAVGNILNDGREVMVLLDQQDSLRLFLPTGAQEWKSEEKYGGSERFLDYVTSGLERNDEKERRYLSQRVIVVDLDQKAGSEVLVVKNESMTGRFLERYRSYGSGSFEVLGWDGLGLSVKAAADKISGYISDFYVEDLDGDGSLELLAAVVSERNSLIKGGKSAVITYRLGSLKK